MITTRNRFHGSRSRSRNIRPSIRESRTFESESVELLIPSCEIIFTDNYGKSVESYANDPKTRSVEADIYSIISQLANILKIDEEQFDKKSFRVMNDDSIYIKGIIHFDDAKYIDRGVFNLEPYNGVIDFEVSATVYEQIFRQATRKSLASYGIS